MVRLSRVLLFIFSLSFASVASATWSIAALDEESRTIAVAGASCSYMVYGIANVLPGEGVVVVQAASDGQARADATAMLSEDKPLDAILKAISEDAKYTPEQQQYALLSFDDLDHPRLFTGDEVDGHKGAMAGRGFSVQVNTMISEDVLSRTFETFEGSKWSGDVELAKAVLASLQAGSEAGGDKRCGDAGSSTAFLSLFKESDHAQVPWLNLVVYGIEPGTTSAVDELARRFEDWKAGDSAAPSFQLFAIPAIQGAE